MKKREYLFAMQISDEEFANLKQVGEILKNSNEFSVSIKIDPDDLIPEPLQIDLKTHLGRCLRTLYHLKLSGRVVH